MLSRIVVLMSFAVLLAPAAASAQPLSRAQVKAMQRELGVPADGSIGPQTRRALKRFERANGFPVDGKPDPDVLAALKDRADTAPADGNDAVAAARSAVGTPYASGGTTLDGFDCSGLTMWAFKKAGVDLPHSSYDQYEMGDEVADGDVQAGDLVFFDTAGSGASHVGIATDATHAISATSSGGVMEHSIVSGYWGDHFIGARRLDSATGDDDAPSPAAPGGGAGTR